MFEIDKAKNQAIFINRVTKSVLRNGMERLLDYLLYETDFFDSPCSTRFHLSVDGGLAQHSINVDDVFVTLCNAFAPNFSKESVHLCALFHDICKCNTYRKVKKSRKTGKILPNGKPEWEDYYGFDFEDDFPYGHGEKSVYILRKFIDLTDEEAMAIRWHMGFSDVSFKGGQQSVSNAIQLYPIIALLHSADIIATSKEE